MAEENIGTSICQQCKKIFFGRKNQKYCSYKCRCEANKAKTYIKICPHCGVEFETHNKKATYCSSICASRKRGDEIRGEYFCEYCGKPRHSDHPNRNRFCSRACSIKARAYGTFEQELEIKKLKVGQSIKHKKVCPVCDVEFIPSRSHQIYCSSSCLYEANLEQKREQWADAYVPKTVICKECGESFTTSCGATRSVFCSEKCLNASMDRVYKDRRKRQMKLAFIEPVGIKKLYMRDGGCCQICGLPVPNTTEPTNPWGATRDHIIPLSKGGKHSMDNCQLAHRICNSLKLDTLESFSIDWFEKLQEEPERWDEQLRALEEQVGTVIPTQGQCIS